MIRKNVVITITAIMFLLITSSVYAVKVGDRGTALWNGRDFPAEITKMKGNRCFIHWIGERGNYDEWRPCSEFKVNALAATKTASPAANYEVGDAVKINWKGSWWNGSIIAVNKKRNKYKIHYDGYASSWDEWVGTNRLQKR